MIRRTAICHCGGLKVTCMGEPDRVVMCHCTLCQRRTGSAFHLAAWFSKCNVEIEGAQHTYTREGDEKIGVTFYFCPVCGSNVYWEIRGISDAIGVAVGCFADPKFPAPTKAIYAESRHHWLMEPEGIASYVRTPDK